MDSLWFYEAVESFKGSSASRPHSGVIEKQWSDLKMGSKNRSGKAAPSEDDGGYGRYRESWDTKKFRSEAFRQECRQAFPIFPLGRDRRGLPYFILQSGLYPLEFRLK